MITLKTAGESFSENVFSREGDSAKVFAVSFQTVSTPGQILFLRCKPNRLKCNIIYKKFEKVLIKICYCYIMEGKYFFCIFKEERL